MSLNIQVDNGDIASYFANDFYEFSETIKFLSRWNQEGMFDDYKSSEDYCLVGKLFGKWLAENEYNEIYGNVVLIDFFKSIVNSYEKNKNA